MSREIEAAYRRVEFLGLPGAGKSTIASLLLADKRWNPNIMAHEKAVIQCLLRRDDGILRNMLKKLPYEVWEPISGVRNALAEFHQFSIKNISLLKLLIEAVSADEMCSTWKSCILYVFFSLGSEHELFSTFLKRSEVVVLEEGFAQGILSAFGYRSSMDVNRDEIDEYICRIPLLTGVVCVDTSPQVCLERLLHRPSLPLILAEERLDHRIKRMNYLDECMRMALDSLERHGISVHHVVSGDQLPKDLACGVRKVCQSWI
jgi:hypothetical protein